jgi:hypothetical protein
MAWANFDDQFPKHPKVIGLSDAAFRLHTSGICYCNQYLTDGVIAAEAIHLLVPRYRKRSLDELLDRQLWVPRADDYEIHDYLDWNRSRSEVAAEKERLHKMRSEAGKKGADARWHGKR